MPSWFPRSAFGLVLVVFPVALGVSAVPDARSNHGGGWITLVGIGIAIVTFPVSALLETRGFKPNDPRNVDRALVIGDCTVLVSLVEGGPDRLAHALFGNPSRK